MPWKEATTMSQREEFVHMGLAPEGNIRALCRRFGISPKTGYKWMHRYLEEGGVEALIDHSRRPHQSPNRTMAKLEDAVLAVRRRHPAWGGRKIHTRLCDQGYGDVPSASTITAILKRHGCIDPLESAKHTPWQRFEAPAPNILWQMDFKGHFPMLRGGRCHPLTILDDCSRYLLGLYACAEETHQTVQKRLITVFRRYGLPERILADNGPPWGNRGDEGCRYTALSVWLMRLDISVTHARVCHPQTLGKDERLHRTLRAEVICGHTFADLRHCQRAFDRWRPIYNTVRPHEALDMAPPASRYRMSLREFSEVLPPIEYGPGDLMRKVQGKGEIYFRNRVFKIGKAFRGYPVALRPTLTDGVFDVFFCVQQVDQINLNHDITTH